MKDTFFRQTGGDFGCPFEWGGEWREFKYNQYGEEEETGGYMIIEGSDAGGKENETYIRYKHVSKSGNIKTRKGFRGESWVDKWIAQNDIDCMK